MVDDREKIETAFHEAGHAVADHVLGMIPSIVSIKPKEGVLGHTSSVGGDMFSEEGAQDLIVVLYAGAEAERLISNDHEKIKCGARGDNEKAEEYLVMIQESESERRRLEVDLRERAAKLVKQHEKSIERIADELVEYETLTDAEIDVLMSVLAGEISEEEFARYRPGMRQHI